MNLELEDHLTPVLQSAARELADRIDRDLAAGMTGAFEALREAGRRSGLTMAEAARALGGLVSAMPIVPGSVADIAARQREHQEQLMRDRLTLLQAGVPLEQINAAMNGNSYASWEQAASYGQAAAARIAIPQQTEAERLEQWPIVSASGRQIELPE